MLTIRLSRVGKKKRPIFRVLISENKKDTVGDFLELLGQYNPHTNKAELKTDRIKYWLTKGAQTSGTVHNLLVDHKIITGEKIKVANIKKKKGGKEESGAEHKPAEKKAEEKAPADKPVEAKGSEQKKENAPIAQEEPKEKAKPEEKKPASSEKKGETKQ